MRKPTIVKIALVIASIIAIFVVSWLLYCYCVMRHRVRAKHFERIRSFDDIKSGDLYLTKFEGEYCGWADKMVARIIGKSWTHVGIFHRDINTHQLFVFERTMIGIRYSKIEDRCRYYAGDIVVRHLQTPLCFEQESKFQDLVNVSLHGHNRDQESIHVGCLAKDHCVVVNCTIGTPLLNFHYPGNELTERFTDCVLKKQRQVSCACTDLILILLTRLNVWQDERTNISQCFLPKFFVEDARCDALFGDVRQVKDFDTDHDHSLAHCLFDGARKCQIPCPSQLV